MTQTRHVHVTTLSVTAGPFRVKFMIGKLGFSLAHGENDSACALHRWPLPGLGKPAGAPGMAGSPRVGKIRIIHVERREKGPSRLRPGRTARGGQVMLEEQRCWSCARRRSDAGAVHGGKVMLELCMEEKRCWSCAWRRSDAGAVHGGEAMLELCTEEKRCWSCAWRRSDAGAVHGGEAMLELCMEEKRCWSCAWRRSDAGAVRRGEAIMYLPSAWNNRTCPEEAACTSLLRA